MIVPAIISRFASKARKGTIERVLHSPRKILLVKQAERLGNIVLLNSAISALKNLFPDTEIDLLLPAKFSGIMQDDGRINCIISVYKKRYISRPWELFRLLIKLRKQRYDIAIDCSDVNSRSSTGAAYALLSGAAVTAGWEIGNLFNLKVRRYDDIIHASEMYIRLLSGVFGQELKGDPYFHPASREPINEKPIVGINCGGRDDKRWPLENFIKLGDILSENNIPAEYIFGPDEEEQRKILQENMPSRCTLLPLTPVSRLKDTFRKYSVFVSSDSGPMHIAWCLNIPVIAIFLSSEMEKFKPLSAGSVLVDGTGDLEPRKVFDMVVTALNSRRIMV